MAGYFTKHATQSVYNGRHKCGNIAVENGEAVKISGDKVVATGSTEKLSGIRVERKHDTSGRRAMSLRFVKNPPTAEFHIVENVEVGKGYAPMNTLDTIVQPGQYVRMRLPQAGDTFELIISDDDNIDAYRLAFEGQAVEYYGNTLVVPFEVNPNADELINLSGVEGFESKAGAEAGQTLLVIPAAFAAPAGYEWQYVLNDSTADIGLFGVAIVGGAAWTSSTTDIASGGKTFAHLVLVKSADDKPYFTVTLDVVAAE